MPRRENTEKLAVAALSGAGRQLLPQDRVDAFVADSHTATLRDNLIPTVSPAQEAALAPQLAGGSGGELRADALGRVDAHAPYSSSALAFNAFGAFYGREQHLNIAGFAGWTAPLELEAQLPITGSRGKPANLDVLLTTDKLVFGVESKLKEYVGRKNPTEWRAPYRTAAMAELLPEGWRRVLTTLLADEWRPRHLRPEQLVKHALALHSEHPNKRRALLYVFWEPTDAFDFPEFAAHRAEIDQFRELLGDDADPTFIVRSYADLLAEWDQSDAPTWVREHVAAVRARYSLALRPSPRGDLGR